jgi:hypothetical protein
MVIVGEWHGVEGPGGPAPVSALLVVITASIDVLSQVVHLLIPVQVPVSIPTQTGLDSCNRYRGTVTSSCSDHVRTSNCYTEMRDFYRAVTTLFSHNDTSTSWQF